MTARLYAMPASHPSIAAMLMLERKAIDYRMMWLLLPFTGPALRFSGFPRRTVPALRLGDIKVQGSREISSALERLAPEPPLYPRDPALRREVEAAHRIGILRVVLSGSLGRPREALATTREGGGTRLDLDPGMSAARPSSSGILRVWRPLRR